MTNPVEQVQELGQYLPDVEGVLAELSQKNVVSRIWQRDHTVWKQRPEEISDRLGWLNVTDVMSEQVPALEAFAREVRDAGFRHVALLGMGGSSLGPEVLRQTFGSADGYPELIVLDSTVPAAVSSVAKRTDPAHTLFLVSSKSGTTLESLVFYRYFRGLVEAAVGVEDAGQSFVAITDPETPLAELAGSDGFRRVFLNPSDIGGRYSVLSYFGLVPAALAGIDVAELVDRAARMREGCASCVPIHDNPGAWSGAAMGALARRGVDKLTVIASPGIASFGLWLEQLLAESTGKEGKGIVPVAGEPLMDAASYGDDRLFVCLRLDGDDNAELDRAVEQLVAAGRPVMRHSLRDRYDIGAEFLRWELATSVAGAILGIQPFDQPNVQSAKDATAQVLRELSASGRLPQGEASFAVEDLGSRVRPGDYVAILAYIPQTDEADEVLSGLRRSIAERFHVATTLGYGPRYLHSTGQLHKGGPNTGVFLFLTAAHGRDLPIPGEAYTFGDLAGAQALGDMRALRSEGRRVARLELGADVVAAVRDLALKLNE
jgi:glucose-6-phosphate isomerase/transaldolase/glucose-6-phosphate isomerase